MKQKPVGIAAVLAVLLASRAKAETPSVIVNLHEVGARNLNLMSIFCDPLYDASTGMPRAGEVRCTFTQAMVSKPTAEDIAKELKELDKPDALSSAKEMLKSCKEAKQPPANISETERRFFDQYKNACATNDAGRMLEAFRFLTREVTAHTCKLRTTGGKTFAFKRLHDNAWECIDSGLGGTVVMTIWRENPKTPWQYREVRAGDTTCNPDKEPLCRRPSTVEFGYRAAPHMACPSLVPW